MISKLALLTNLFVAFVALATPSLELDAIPVYRWENHQSQTNVKLRASNYVYSGTNWAGAVCFEYGANYTTINGSFEAPKPSGDVGFAADVSAGLSGFSCINMIRAGVTFMVFNGEVTWTAWYQWLPDQKRPFSGIGISPGDNITITVAATSQISGYAIVENTTTGQIASMNLTAPDPSTDGLCGQDAEWVVGTYQQPETSQVAPLANFGAVTFGNAAASGPSTSCSLSNAQIVNIAQNNRVMTSVSTIEGTVAIRYRS